MTHLSEILGYALMEVFPFWLVWKFFDLICSFMSSKIQTRRGKRTGSDRSSPHYGPIPLEEAIAKPELEIVESKVA